jgi:hypothetical protein
MVGRFCDYYTFHLLRLEDVQAAVPTLLARPSVIKFPIVIEAMSTPGTSVMDPENWARR